MQPTQKTRKRILWLSDWANSGFGVVAKNLVHQIMQQTDDIEILILGINFYDKDPLIMYGGRVTVMDCRRTSDGSSFDEFGRYVMIDMLMNYPEPFDMLFMLHDVGTIVLPLLSLIACRKKKMELNQKNFKTMCYVPIDCGHIPAQYFENFGFFDRIVTMNEFSKKVITKTNKSLFKKTSVVPHGVNSDDFFPMPAEEIAAFRKEYFGAENADKIIFSNINRNQPRKDLPTTIFGFIEARKQNTTGKEFFLYLHCAEKDGMGNDLPAIFMQTDLKLGVDYKIADDSFWIGQYGAPTETLNKIYNATDICVTTTLGEGWGLTVTEAMATKTPTIVPLNTSLIEISGNGSRCHVLENMYPVVNSDNAIRCMTDYQELADVMNEAALQRIAGSDADMIDRAYKYVRTLTWKSISDKFLGYINEL